MTTRRQATFPGRLSLDSQTENGSEIDWDSQTPVKPHFTDFFSGLSIAAPSSSTLLSIPRRFTTTLQTYHDAATRIPTYRALAARITRRRRTAIVSLAIIAVLILLAIVTETVPATLKFRKPQAWEFNDPIDAVLALVPNVGPLHERRIPHDLVLEPEQELGVLVSFMAAVQANALPFDIDPSKPLDPQLVVGFDTRADGAMEEVEALVEETWSNYPVVIFSQVS